MYRDSRDLLEGNYGRAVSALRAQMAFWGTLPIATMGRVALLKMVALPRLLYHFANIPVYIKPTTFRSFESDIRHFICRMAETEWH